MSWAKLDDRWDDCPEFNDLSADAVGWYAYWRVGGDVLSINAFRVMSIPTTA